MLKREGEPFAEVSGIMPAACDRPGRSVAIKNAIIQMARFVNTEYLAATALRAEKRKVAGNDAVIDAVTNGEWRRDLPIGFDLVATRCRECRKVCLPKCAPSGGMPLKLAS